MIMIVLLILFGCPWLALLFLVLFVLRECE
jgi:hypothetical protein